MFNYSIVNIDPSHVEEVCQDVIRQTKEGVADLALFKMTLVPEGDPVINKAAIEGEKYIIHRDRLKKEGVECGILVQATIGHGYKLNADFPFQHLMDLTTGEKRFVVCPFDENFKDYLRSTFKTLAELSPKTIMVDDDFRLMARQGRGCACPLHMKAVSEKAGREVTREELHEAIFGAKKDKELIDIFVETQKEALIGSAKAMREGVDAVDPTLPMSFCCVGTEESAADIAKILAGKGNPPMVRVNNGNYHPAGAKLINQSFHRAAKQIAALKNNGVEVILAETDTCPQNRYSTSAQNLHTHFTGTILEGATGAKHWITRLATFEPKSGEAYRKKLAANKGFYEKLAELQKQVRWQGAATPVSTSEVYFGDYPALAKYGWSVCVFERLGLPCFFTADPNVDAAVFLEDVDVALRTNDEILNFFKGTAVLSGGAAKICSERGLSEFMGVDVKNWTGVNLSGEYFPKTNTTCAAQVDAMELVPLNEKVVEESTVYHIPDGKTKNMLFPGCTSFKNSLGGTVIVFCGNPDTEYHYLQAFSFLNETRKTQIADLLKRTGNLPVYYPDDMEMLLRAGKLADGSLLVVAFDVSLDRADELPLVVEGEVEKVMQLTSEGQWKEVSSWGKPDRIIVNTPVYTLEPVVLKIHTK